MQKSAEMHSVQKRLDLLQSVDMFEKKYIYQLEDLPRVVTDVILMAAERPKNKAVVLSFQGDLGAGKTTFVQELAQQLGVTDIVTSPTFTIMKQYQTTHPQFSELVHIDAYRIEELDELRPLQFSQLLEQAHTLICIEWPEKIAPVLPPDHIHISIEIDETERRIAQVTGEEV